MMPIIKTDSLTKSFGTLTAVNSIDITLSECDTKGLVGPNGAGKTTLFNLISGAFTPSKGEIYFRGENITDYNPHERADLGLGRTFQISNTFDGLTVLENLRLGLLSQHYDFRWLVSHPISDINDYEDINDEAKDLAKLINLDGKLHNKARDLSHGQKRSLELGITYSIDPDVLLLDEPTAGLAVDNTEYLVNILDEIAEEKTIFVIEHNIDFLEKIITDVAVMDEGQIIAEGTLDDVRNDENVREVYL
jgi:branched-chain amino acid transport system ATP-binding protein